MMPSLRPFLETAIVESKGELTIQDVFKLVFTHKAKIWLAFEETSHQLYGVAMTEDVEYPQYSNLRVTLLGGREMAQWRDEMDEAFCGYAKAQNLRFIEVVGRKGFQRMLENLGYEYAYTMLLKQVKEVYCG
jgi:hypothetical protein